MILMTLLQIQNVADAAEIAGEAGTISMSYWELAKKGGWVMVPIAILSIIAVYIFVDRWMAIKKASREDQLFMSRIKDYIHEGKIEAALTLCQSVDTPEARMIEKGIARIGRPLSDVHEAIDNLGNLEVYKLEKGLPLLATIAGGAPMIGFLGTVMGMIRAFYDMSMAGNNIDVGLLSNGIYTAMVTTVAGLVVGIVAYFAYNILVANVDKVVNKLGINTTAFLDLLNEPAK